LWLELRLAVGPAALGRVDDAVEETRRNRYADRENPKSAIESSGGTTEVALPSTTTTYDDDGDGDDDDDDDERRLSRDTHTWWGRLRPLRQN
ncbi:hypothetical protein KM043_000033, partial [Ampulex compressa]